MHNIILRDGQNTNMESKSYDFCHTLLAFYRSYEIEIHSFACIQKKKNPFPFYEEEI